MITAWRLVREKRAADAFLGEGARLYGGRWNHRGTPVVYVADSLALAALEQFVHLGRAHALLRFVFFRVEIPDDDIAVESLPPHEIPSNWREEPPPDETKDVGTAWVRSAPSPVLRVPSVIVPIENNYLLNPRHQDSTKIRIGKPEPFSFDPRVWK